MWLGMHNSQLFSTIFSKGFITHPISSSKEKTSRYVISKSKGIIFFYLFSQVNPPLCVNNSHYDNTNPWLANTNTFFYKNVSNLSIWKLSKSSAGSYYPSNDSLQELISTYVSSLSFLSTHFLRKFAKSW